MPYKIIENTFGRNPWTENDNSQSTSNQEGGRAWIERQFTPLFLQHARNYLLSVTHGKAIHQLDDLVQTAVLRAIERADQYRPGTNFDAWFRTILLNAFRDQYKRGKKYAYIQAHNGVEITQGSLAQSAPDHQFEERELIELVRSAAEKHQINPGWVGLFIDVYFYHMEYKEAAEKYAVPIGTVMSRLHRTSKQILDAIQKYHPILHTHLTSLIRQKKDATTP